VRTSLEQDEELHDSSFESAKRGHISQLQRIFLLSASTARIPENPRIRIQIRSEPKFHFGRSTNHVSPKWARMISVFC